MDQEKPKLQRSGYRPQRVEKASNSDLLLLSLRRLAIEFVQKRCRDLDLEVCTFIAEEAVYKYYIEFEDGWVSSVTIELNPALCRLLGEAISDWFRKEKGRSKKGPRPKTHFVGMFKEADKAINDDPARCVDDKDAQEYLASLLEGDDLRLFDLARAGNSREEIACELQVIKSTLTQRLIRLRQKLNELWSQHIGK